jgi:hypothetical protein
VVTDTELVKSGGEISSLERRKIDGHSRARHQPAYSQTKESGLQTSIMADTHVPER